MTKAEILNQIGHVVDELTHQPQYERETKSILIARATFDLGRLVELIRADVQAEKDADEVPQS